MGNSASDSSKVENRIPVDDLRRYAADWHLDCELRQHSKQILYCHQDYLKKLFWFFDQKGISAVGTTELKQFFLYLNTGPQDPGGRWGNPLLKKPIRPISIHGYYRVLRAWFNYLVDDEAISCNSMAKIKPPVVRNEVKQPVPREHITIILEATRRSKYPARDEALVLTLLDTGIRASELCGLQRKDLDLTSRSFRVLGKGNKYRTCYLGKATPKAISRYLRNQHREPEDRVFLSERLQPFTASGLRQLLERLCESAGIPAIRCHALRRTFAVEFLRNSQGSVFTCQALLGHSDLTMTRRYCAVADTDMENEHRQFSPADRLSTNDVR
jgi:integrase/recombinase XerC